MLDAKPLLSIQGRQWHNTVSTTTQRALVPAVVKPLGLIRHSSVVTTPAPPVPRAYSTESTTVVPPTKPYKDLVIGVPTEIFEGERFARLIKYWRDNQARDSWKKTFNEVRVASLCNLL